MTDRRDAELDAMVAENVMRLKVERSHCDGDHCVQMDGGHCEFVRKYTASKEIAWGALDRMVADGWRYSVGTAIHDPKRTEVRLWRRDDNGMLRRKSFFSEHHEEIAMAICMATVRARMNY